MHTCARSVHTQPMPPAPAVVGASAVVRTTSFHHPACDVAAFLGARPPLHALRLIVCGGGENGDTPSTRLPQPPPFYTATAPITDLLAPAFIEWAAPSDGGPCATAVTAPGRIDGGGAACLTANTLTLTLPGADWRRLGLGGTRDAGGADAYSVTVALRSRRAEREAERKATHCSRPDGQPASPPSACGAAGTAHKALTRLAPAPVGVVLLGGTAGGPPPPLAGAAAVTPTIETRAVAAPAAAAADVPAALGLGEASAVDADAARSALELMGAAAAGLTLPEASPPNPTTTLTVDAVHGLLSPAYAAAAVAAARAAVEADGENGAAASPPLLWAAVVGVPFPDAPRPLADGAPPAPCARPDADRGVGWAVVVVPGGRCALVAASGGGDGGARV